jgi:hypothetical protein
LPEQSTTALTALGVIAAVLVLGALVYLAMTWIKLRARNRLLLQGPSPPDALSHRDALNARHSAERPTEDDLQRETLGPRGVPGQASPAKMTPQRDKKTPRHLEPGHTA